MCLFVPSLLIPQILYAKQDVVGCRCRRRCRPLWCTRIVRRYKIQSTLNSPFAIMFSCAPHHTLLLRPEKASTQTSIKEEKNQVSRDLVVSQFRTKKGKPTNCYVSLLFGPAGVMGIYRWCVFVYRDCYYACIVDSMQSQRVQCPSGWGISLVQKYNKRGNGGQWKWKQDRRILYFSPGLQIAASAVGLVVTGCMHTCYIYC